MAFKLPTVKRPQAANNSPTSSSQNAIGGAPTAKRLKLLGGALIVLLLLVVVSAYLDNRAAAHGTRYIAESSRLLMLSQRMAKAAERSLSGDYLAFEELTKSREEAATILTLLDKGDSNLPATSGQARPVLNEVTAAANKTLADTLAMEEGRP